MRDEDPIITWEPPTEKDLFEQFCYEMYMKHKDEVYEWEKRMPTITSKGYIKKNKDLLKKEFKRIQKKGNL